MTTKWENPLEDGAPPDGDGDDVDQAKLDQEIQAAAFGTADVEDDTEALDALLRERWYGLLHPDTLARGAYDMGQLVIMMYLGYLLPIRQAFTKTATGPISVAVDLIIDLSVWVDMFLQMRMCYYDKKTRKLITDQKRIKREYIRSWFFVDFFSVVPADQVLLLVGTIMVDSVTSEVGIEWGVKLMEWSITARLMRLLRLVRLVKIKQLLNLEKVTNNVYMLTKRLGLGVTKLQVSFYFRVVFLVALIFAAGHFLGCIWLMIGRHNVLHLQNPQGWMVNAYAQDTVNKTKDFVSCIGNDFDDKKWNSIYGSSCTHKFKCIPIPPENPYDVDCSWIESRSDVLGGTGYDNRVGASEGEQYLQSFYFTLVTLTTVGYGDILPDTEGEHQFVLTCILLGAFLYAYIIGDFTNLLTNLSQERDEFDRKMRTINDLLAYIDAPQELRGKVQDYYDFKFENKEGAADLLDEMPPSLKVALVKHRYGDLLARVPFFASLHGRAQVELCQQMKSFTVTPGDLIMEKGTWHDELLILSKGSAKTATDEDSRGDASSTVYEVGSFWGEMQFLGLEKQRTLTVVANSYCEIASLSPAGIASGSVIHSRLAAYAKLRAEVEAKRSTGDGIDLASLNQELEDRFAFILDNEDEGDGQEEPTAPTTSVGSLSDDGAVVAVLEKMQLAQRQTDAQLGMITQQLKELTAAVSQIRSAE